MPEPLKVTSGWYAPGEQPVYRHVAVLYVAPEFLLGIIQGKFQADPALFPPDVQVRGAEWDEGSRSFRLILESKEYPITADGNQLFVISLRLRHVPP
jgi:hypothetical protein